MKLQSLAPTAQPTMTDRELDALIPDWVSGTQVTELIREYRELMASAADGWGTDEDYIHENDYFDDY